jgi:DmsE family decaheme c-type cytochrome
MKFRRSSFVFEAIFVVTLWAASVAGARADTKPAQPSDTAAANPEKQSGGAADSAVSDYVGTETCKSCHENMYDSYEKTPHWKTTLDTKGGPSRQGCEGCHGPGAAHVAGGGDKTKIFIFKEHSAKEIDARCLTCHSSDSKHMNAINSEHAKSGVSCISCHSPHHAQTQEFLLVKAQPVLCYSCHVEIKPAFAQPFHHKVEEGLMSCSDCHDPHGTFKSKQLKTTADQNAICAKCHTETAGPFAFEHPVVKAEGCVACHSPHGSPNARMLNVSNVNILCLQCHSATNLTAFPNAVSEQGGPVHNQRAQYTPCTNCHSQIHGSNATFNFFR